MSHSTMTGITVFFSPEDDVKFRNFAARFCSEMLPKNDRPPRISLFAKLSSNNDASYQKLLRNLSHKHSSFKVDVQRAFTVETSTEHSTVSLGLSSPIVHEIYEEIQSQLLATNPTLIHKKFIVPRINIAEHVPHDIALKLKRAFNNHWSKVEGHSSGLTASGLAMRNYYPNEIRWFPSMKRVNFLPAFNRFIIH